MKFAVLTALAACMACSSPPGGPPDAAAFGWSVVLSETSEAILAVCGEGDDIYAVGGTRNAAMVLEWTGSEWYAPTLPAGTDVLWWCWVAPGGGDVLAVGDSGTVLRRTATGWDHEPDVGIGEDITLYGVWGIDAQNAIVVGGNQNATGEVVTAAHLELGRWRVSTDPGLPQGILFKVWGSDPSNVWAVGARGTIVHYDGLAWASAVSPTSSRLIAVWGTRRDDVYAVGGDANGELLRFDGDRWNVLATTPEPLSAVWGNPGDPLYVGGNRGYLARLDRRNDIAEPTTLSATVPAADVCMHALFGTGGSVIAAGSDLLAGGVGSWRGALFVHGGSFSGPIVRGPDAGVIDGGVSPDATVVDAMPPTDGPGPTEICAPGPNACATGLECWLLLTSGVSICTKPCSSTTECTEYGAGACCVRPGFQTLETVCIPAEYVECQ